MTVRAAVWSDYQTLYAGDYMSDGLKCAHDILLDIVERCPASFLDYGCGRGLLMEWINRHTTGFACGIDVAGPIGPGELGAHTARGGYDYVIACDVLEHLAEENLAAELAQFRTSAKRGALLTIANMSDIHQIKGEDVELHLIQRPGEWWAERLGQAWPGARIVHRPINKDRFAFIVEFQ